MRAGEEEGVAIFVGPWSNRPCRGEGICLLCVEVVSSYCGSFNGNGGFDLVDFRIWPLKGPFEISHINVLV